MSRTGPSIAVRKAAAAQVEADVLVVGVRPAEPADGSVRRGVALRTTEADISHAVDAAFGGTLTQVLTTLGATGKAEEVTLLPSNGAVRAPVVAAVGLGSDSPSTEQLRRAAGGVVRRLEGKAGSVAFALSCGDPTAIRALAEGALLGSYVFNGYRTTRREAVASITLLSERARESAVRNALRVAQATAGAVNLTRHWVNLPPSDLYPETFARSAESEAGEQGLDIAVLDHEELAAGGYGGILGVGQGSERPPRLVRIGYRHPEARRNIALVGKGITFDTGGISLKPNDGMTTMKSDMSGAATVLASVLGIAEIGLPVNVTGWAAMAENMPSGTAQRPSDILRMYGGKTVEVLNTDAEGRLVLADALVRASEEKPDLIVDVATLTGACVVALGTRVFGIMGNDETFCAQIREAASRAGEAAWPLPIPEDSRDRLDSRFADLANVAAQRSGGALVAAAFLREFVGEGIAWAHLDIAGPSYNDGGAWGYTPSGGTGAGVRTLIALAEAISSGEF